MGRDKPGHKATCQVAASIYKLLIGIFYVCIYVSVDMNMHVDKNYGSACMVCTIATRCKIPILIRTMLAKTWADPFSVMFPMIPRLGKHITMLWAAGWPLCKDMCPTPCCPLEPHLSDQPGTPWVWCTASPHTPYILMGCRWNHLNTSRFIQPVMPRVPFTERVPLHSWGRATAFLPQ